MSWGHANIAAIGTTQLNSYAGTNFKSILQSGDVHAEVSTLKDNLRVYKSKYPFYFGNVPTLDGNGTDTFDNDTKLNLQVFQLTEGLSTDGTYGQTSRNRMALKIGASPKGFIRLPVSTSNYINYNDTSSGMSSDSRYKLDHSWLDRSAFRALESIASSYKAQTGKRLEVNDCCLIDGANTPEHKSHEDGKDADFRNAGLSTSEAKALLSICIANSGVSKVLYYTNHGINSNKIKVRSDHADHFHIDFV